MKITVVGSGGWGTALALLLVENGHDVTLWSHTPAKAVALEETRENPMLKGVPLPEEMHFTTDMACVKGCGAIVMATPSFAVRSTAAQLKNLVDEGTIIVSVTKGIEKSTSLRMTQIIEEEVGGKCPVVALSGPSHAEEVGRHIPTGVVVTCEDERSQHKNKARAMKVLASRILAAERERQNSELSADRKAQVGSGDRSERIRTYNFPQGRCTDHRINLTLYKLDQVMNGDLDEMIDALTAADQAEKLKASQN